MAGVSNLRFLQRKSLASEQNLYLEYYRDLIRSYGIDTIYFRKDLSFYDVPSGLCSYAYGEDSTATYYLSANMVVYAEMLGDSFLLNNFGIETDGDMAVYFTIDDFTRQFQDQLGTPTTANISVPLLANINNFTGALSGVSPSADLSASVSAYLDFNNTSGNLSGTLLLNAYENAYVNHRLYEANRYPYGRVINGTLSGGWTAFVNASGSGIASGEVSGLIDYFAPQEQHTGPGWKVAPQVGDFFRIDFQADNNEEYVISQVSDRDLQNSGISPLLGKFIWKCTCTRRDPSHEVVMNGQGDQQEPLTASKLDQNDWTEVTSNDIFNYGTTDIDLVDLKNSDEVYGGYGAFTP